MRHYLLPLIALLALASCKNEPERAAFETKQEQQDRIKAMYAMRAIGVEFVAMFEQASIQPDRARELATLLVGQAQALPQHFSKQPNTTSLVKPEVWADQAAFAIALSDFSRKARLPASATFRFSNTRCACSAKVVPTTWPRSSNATCPEMKISLPEVTTAACE